MQGSSTSRAVFVSGLMIGVALALGSVLMLRHKDEPAVVARPTAPRSVALGAGPATPPAKADAASCGDRLLMTRAGGESTVSLDPPPAKALPGQVASLLLQGKEAVASGRPRDAEASFMNACRTAAVDAGADAAVEMADAKYQLARLYSQSGSAAGASREQMLAQARALFTASLQTYTARYGEQHEKTRFAAEALAGLGAPATPAETPVAVAQAPAPATPPAPKPAPKPAAKPAPANVVAKAEAPKAEPAKPEPVKPEPTKPEPTKPVAAKLEPSKTPEVVAKAPPPTEAPKAARAAREQPSFDCRRARSASERIICSDDDLARQDRELGKVYARAKSAAPDPRAFQRDSDAQWARRESTCRDRECLQRWYAQRREQLQAQSPEQPSMTEQPPAEATGEAYSSSASDR